MNIPINGLLIAVFPLPGVGGDETVFADGKVNHIGQVIGIVVAESQPLAQRATKAVKVTYEDLPSIITIEVITRLFLSHDVIII